MKSALFIHRSVGHNLIADGQVYNLVKKATPEFSFSDYDHNLGLLSASYGSARLVGLKFPGDNTNPADYAALFSDSIDAAYQPTLDFALGYDVVIIKSCYPNANITSDQQLETIKGYYQSIAQFFANHLDEELIIVTSPPLRRLRTSPAAAARARQLATWIATQPLGQNVRVFNLFNLLANPENQPHANTLYADYCRVWPFDSHPNAKASQVIAPLFIDFIAQRAR